MEEPETLTAVVFEQLPRADEVLRIAQELHGARVVVYTPSSDMVSDEWTQSSHPAIVGLARLDSAITPLVECAELLVYIGGDFLTGAGVSPTTGMLREMVWRGLHAGISCRVVDRAGSTPSDVLPLLESLGVAAQVAVIDRERRRYTMSLPEIRVDADHASSGLWTRNGQLDYQNLGLPLGLLRRIHAWQRDWDQHMDPYAADPPAWWYDHSDAEKLRIAVAIDRELRGRVPVKIWLHDRDADPCWVSIACGTALRPTQQPSRHDRIS